ncbi:hypothetical protein JHK87_053081 [Glycine soja]|nr:hypothetical protein JHK87_053081 [Glycine soja]
MDLYFTSQNVIKSLKPMSSIRSYASIVWLNGEMYVFGGGNGYVWYDTVQLNGAIYATGRFDGNDYLRYALGGFDGFFLDLSSVILHTPCLYRDYNLTFLTLTATIWDRFKMSQD